MGGVEMNNRLIFDISASKYTVFIYYEGGFTTIIFVKSTIKCSLLRKFNVQIDIFHTAKSMICFFQLFYILFNLNCYLRIVRKLNMDIVGNFYNQPLRSSCVPVCRRRRRRQQRGVFSFCATRGAYQKRQAALIKPIGKMLAKFSRSNYCVF